MTKEEIQHLAKLARIELSDEEVDKFTTEMSAILDYVSAVTDIVGDDALTAPQVGARYNVFRKDEVTNGADEHTEALLAEMPQTQGRFMVVKKILNPDA
jgi:aspartyl-tRNA(Asn)/glutamyl-tRNA(Gln) amidotransferase subunit C